MRSSHISVICSYALGTEKSLRMTERLASRHIQRLTAEELAEFQDAPYLVGRHCDEVVINEEALRVNPNPKLLLQGIHKPAAAK